MGRRAMPRMKAPVISLAVSGEICVGMKPWRSNSWAVGTACGSGVMLTGTSGTCRGSGSKRVWVGGTIGLELEIDEGVGGLGPHHEHGQGEGRHAGSGAHGGEDFGELPGFGEFPDDQ